MEEKGYGEGWELFDLLNIISMLGNIYYKLGQHNKQQECLKELTELESRIALQVIKPKKGRPTSFLKDINVIIQHNKAVQLNNLAGSKAHNQEYKEAEELFEQACNIYKAIGENVLLAETLGNRAAAYVKKSEFYWDNDDYLKMYEARHQALKYFNEAFTTILAITHLIITVFSLRTVIKFRKSTVRNIKEFFII